MKGPAEVNGDGEAKRGGQRWSRVEWSGVKWQRQNGRWVYTEGAGCRSMDAGTAMGCGQGGALVEDGMSGTVMAMA